MKKKKRMRRISARLGIAKSDSERQRGVIIRRESTYQERRRSVKRLFSFIRQQFELSKNVALTVESLGKLLLNKSMPLKRYRISEDGGIGDDNVLGRVSRVC